MGLTYERIYMKIIVAVVTYNRSMLLSRCIDNILLQSRMPDEIVVINNGSTDDTEEILRAKGIKYITQENVGSAGGWHRAISISIEENFDAVWLMDDDGFPHKDALLHLEKEMQPNIACAASLVLQENQPDRFVFDMPKLNQSKLPIIFSLPRKYSTINALEAHSQDGVYEFAQLFNGALISTDAVRKIGNINTEYFIYGDEVDFFYRIREAGAVISVLAAKHFHPDVTIRPYNKMKIYYYIKNTLILYRKYFPWPSFYQFAGIGLILFRIAKKNGLKTSISLISGSLAPVFYTAIYRGLRGRIAKDYDF